jgi:hypothetical protein
VISPSPLKYAFSFSTTGDNAEATGVPHFVQKGTTIFHQKSVRY